MSKTLKFSKKLLVEGNDDLHVVKALCTQFQLNENFEIIDAKGINNLMLQVPARLKEPDTDTLGIIVDADTNLSERWSQLRALFNTQEIQLPEHLPQEGLIVTGNGHPTIGIWIMPNNNLNGMLEDFIRFLVPTNDQLMPEITDNLNRMEAAELTKYNPVHKSKAIIHSWLSVQEDPGTPMGLSITKRYLTTNQENCETLINWLNSLFNK